MLSVVFAVVFTAVPAVLVAAALLVSWQAPPSARRRHEAGRAGDPAAGTDHASGLRPVLTVPMLLDLVAAGLAGGVAPPRAVALVAECLERARDPAAAELSAFAARLRNGQPRSIAGPGGERGEGAAPASSASPAMAALGGALDLSGSTGAAPAGLIRAAAEEHRRRAHADQVRAAHRLGVWVLLPTGLCLLPAFVLLTVVPLVIEMVTG